MLLSCSDLQAHKLPAWFDPDWLSMREAPVNKMIREAAGQTGEQWLGRSQEQWLATGGGDDGGKIRPGFNDRGWWREDDPYWMLRDWGDHPMRWWTLLFAAVLAGRSRLLSLCVASAATLEHMRRQEQDGLYMVSKAQGRK